MTDPNVLTFPSNRRPRQIAKTGDAKLVSNIRSAWRKLDKAIKTARDAGLDIEADFRPYPGPTITRRL
jgi:hypothetical protein